MKPYKDRWSNTLKMYWYPSNTGISTRSIWYLWLKDLLSNVFKGCVLVLVNLVWPEHWNEQSTQTDFVSYSITVSKNRKWKWYNLQWGSNQWSTSQHPQEPHYSIDPFLSSICFALHTWHEIMFCELPKWHRKHIFWGLQVSHPYRGSHLWHCYAAYMYHDTSSFIGLFVLGFFGAPQQCSYKFHL
jgi:hypothetical protein